MTDVSGMVPIIIVIIIIIIATTGPSALLPRRVFFSLKG